AATLAESRRGWAGLAGALELDLSTTPLAVSGLIDGVKVVARAERSAASEHRLVIAATFDEPLGLGLTVQPRRRHRGRREPESERRRGRRSFSRLFDEQARRTRTRFRRAFDIRAAEVWEADQLLDQSLQEALLSLKKEFPAMELSDAELRVTHPTVPSSRSALEHLLRSVTVVARLVDLRARGLHPDPASGPYR
ncbi:MAG: hypothetical protein JRI23_07315, partial [Deltaproteobacteria bacterium]|nr:hypothetical protein [Deltaproteobacteria bacterium]MBW2531402.1 hypothetical protein [Deltaproteobacteria bacterium]